MLPESTTHTNLEQPSDLSKQYEEAFMRITASYQRLQTHRRVLNSEIEYLKQEIRHRDQEIKHRDSELIAFRSSTSWKVTRPIRLIGRLIKRFR